MSRILVTGASGFVGGHLCDQLSSLGYSVIGTTRTNVSGPDVRNYKLRQVADVRNGVDWGPVLKGVDFVVHLAARVHVMRDEKEDALAEFRKVNVDGTVALLRHEGMRGVKRVIYVSTAKVFGDATCEAPFSAADNPAPSDPYAVSKLEAERCVEEIGAGMGFETTIIRPPLVYGPGVGGNFLRLLKMVDKGMPLPFGLINNCRSIVFVANLCDLIRECLTNLSAPGKRFLVSDNHDVSTPDLIRMVASSISRPARLLPFPEAMLRFAAMIAGRSAEASRLTGSLQVDISHTMQTLNWCPPVSMSDGIRSTMEWYEEQRVNEQL